MQELLVDTIDSTTKAISEPALGSRLVSWIEGKVTPWRDYRDQNHQARFQSYYRLFEGRWGPEEMSRASERSRLITPVLSEAVESTVAELEEAIFGKEVWFDLVDDILDEDPLDIMKVRDQLREDLEAANCPSALCEALLIGAIWGQITLKVSVELVKRQDVQRNQVTAALETSNQEEVLIKWLPVLPQDLLFDPAAECVDEMLGIAHETERPLHYLQERVRRGVFREEALELVGPQAADTERGIRGSWATMSRLEVHDTDVFQLTEYHGKVPLGLMPKDSIVDGDLMGAGSGREDTPLVEAIVTYANKGVLLRATENRFVKRDRSIVSAGWDKRPGQFLGRGVIEKGYNAQKALDAEVRARMDSLGYVTAPMMGIDATKLNRKAKMTIGPGKFIPVNGRPSEIMEPIKFGALDQSTFQQSQEMERWVQQAAGVLSPASPTQQSQQAGPFATSIISANFRQRNKRALLHISNNVIAPLLQKTLWRYMQFEPQKYPKDYKFFPKATMGVVAREIEANTMTQLMGMLPQEFGPVNLTVAQGIIENSSIPNKGMIMEQIQKALEPDPEAQKRAQEAEELQLRLQEAEVRSQELENEKTAAEIELTKARALKERALADAADDKVGVEQARVMNQQDEIQQFTRQNDIAEVRLALEDRKLDIAEDDAKAKRAASRG